MVANTNLADTSDREIVHERVVNAPRELVWKVWVEPEHVAKWWGPFGFTNTIYEMDVRPGGVWRLTMHGPDGIDYPNYIRFIEVTPPQRLVYDHSEDENADMFRSTVTFTAMDDGKTAIRLAGVFPTEEARDYAAEHYGAVEGGRQTLSRLADYAEAMA